MVKNNKPNPSSKNSGKNKKTEGTGQPGFKLEPEKMRILILGAIALAFFIILQFVIFPEIDVKKLNYSEFYEMVNRNPQTHEIGSCELVENVIRGKLASGGYFLVNVPMNDLELIPLLRKNVGNFSVNPPKTFLKNLIYSLLPVVFLIGFFWFFVYRGAQQGGGRLLSFGKTRAKQGSDKQQVTFQDVAGCDEAKEELKEIIEFLKDPKRFQKLGGRIPKGVLLMGPPGTGKTLLARAVAGEANVPFYSISGSDFVEMFVGVGAARVRDLFEQAKKSAKQSGRGSIIFIDELDAVGRQRFAGIGGGHDEREQTLNALLVEMDGFDGTLGVILVAATNRPDVLDPALVRPGRFDRQIVVDRPDMVGREAILRIHTRNVTLANDVDLGKLARMTPGFSGADLANLVNEGALLAARYNKEAVTMHELEASIERVMAGPERRSRIISKKEKEVVAVHESGHTLLTLMLEGVDPLKKVSIIPRGHAALGYTLQMPTEDRYMMSEKELVNKMIILMGGRVAEEIVFHEITTGAQNDLEVATGYAQRMVCEFGMSKRLGNLTFGKKDRQVFLGRDLMREKDYSESTAILIDEEVRRIVDSCYKRAHQLLTQHQDKLKLLSDRLLEKETLEAHEVREIVEINGPILESSNGSVAQS